MKNMTPNYADLVKLIRRSLRDRHPEWIEADGQSPMCDLYEARFAEVLQLCMKPAAVLSSNRKRSADTGASVAAA